MLFQDLIAKITQLEAHNVQLKNILNKKIHDGEGTENETRKKPFDFSK